MQLPPLLPLSFSLDHMAGISDPTELSWKIHRDNDVRISLVLEQVEGWGFVETAAMSKLEFSIDRGIYNNISSLVYNV